MSGPSVSQRPGVSVSSAKRATVLLGGPGTFSGSFVANRDVASRWRHTLPIAPTRFRLRFRSYSRFSLANGGAMTLTCAFIGTPAYPAGAGDGRWLGLMTGTGTQIDGGTVAIDGTSTPQFTPWFTNTGQIKAGQSFVISAGFRNLSGVSSTVYNDYMGGFSFVGDTSGTTSNAANVGGAAAPVGAQVITPYIEMALEVEYPSIVDPAGSPRTPIVLCVGDSITLGLTGLATIGQGASTTSMVQDETWVGQAALALGFVPVNLGIGSKKASDFVTNWAAYTAVADLATTVPDYAVVALGINDISAASVSAATLEASLVTILGNLATLGIPASRVYLATMVPGGYNASSFTATTGTATTAATVLPMVSTAGIVRGLGITTTGIPASTYVFSVDSPTQLTLSAAATVAAGATVTLATSPSQFVSAAQELTRRAVNEWMASKPLGVAGIWDFAKALERPDVPSMSDPELISVYPHPDPRGYARMAEAAKLAA